MLGNAEAIFGLSLDNFVPLWYTSGSCLQCWAHLGVIFGGLGDCLGPPCGYLGSCRGYVGAVLGLLGASSLLYSLNIKNRFL